MGVRESKLRSAALACLLVALGPFAMAFETAGTEPEPDTPVAKRGRAYAHMMRSMCEARRGEFRAAAGEIRRAIELQPDSVDAHLQGIR